MSNGAGGSRFGGNQYEHLFDGPALLRKFTIRNGKVFYESKYLDCETFRKNRKHNRIVVTEFGTRSYPDPCKTIFSRLASYFFMNNLFNDNSQVGFWSLSDELFAVGESPIMSKIDAENLSTLDRIDLRKIVSISTAIAHVHSDGHGNLYAMGSSISHYNLIKITKPKDGKSPFNAAIVAKIPVRRLFSPAYYHSFCITEKFWVFIEQPLILSVKSLLQEHYFGGTNSQIMEWRPEYQVRSELVN